ncbi:hypothetical protein [Caballeronia terrestris]|jgi:hypothetical protein|uniref:hypothetical protein n=1 Tax=Caballeronia terrestris TaxID=1226301 RepID=UPI000A9525C1|nr:hypothetical protein [Caballeronia terrestris]
MNDALRTYFAEHPLEEAQDADTNAHAERLAGMQRLIDPKRQEAERLQSPRRGC